MSQKFGLYRVKIVEHVSQNSSKIVKNRQKLSDDIYGTYLIAILYVCLLFFSRSDHELGRGVSEKVSAVGFCLGSGLFGSCNSN